MKMKILLLNVLMLLCSGIVWSQQNLDFSGKAGIVSPQINADNSVTFCLMAPNAKEVILQGDWMPANGWIPGSVKMNRDTIGLWSYTTAVLPSELYGYSFIVDGLKTTDPNNVYLIRDVSTVVNVFLIGGGKADNYKVTDVPHGTVARRWYDSPGLSMTRRMTIYTPPGYESGKKSYPVLYLLHGVGGDEEAWIALGRAAQIMDNLIAQGKAEPMIVVMTNGHTSNSAAPGESSKGFYKPVMMTPDVFNGKMESSFNDVVTFIDNNYRTIKKKSGRAIAGLSMGGFHSLYISVNNPDTFDYIGLFSPAILPPQNSTADVYQNIDNKLETLKTKGCSLYWIAIGKTDFLYKNVADYRQRLDKMNFPYVYRESDGGHTWVNWRIYLTEFAPMLFKK
jgi:enterochelin esterase family protein